MLALFGVDVASIVQVSATSAPDPAKGVL